MRTDWRLAGSTWGFFRGEDPSEWIAQSDAVQAITALGLGVEVWPTRGRKDPEPSSAQVSALADACRDAPFVSLHMRGQFWNWNPDHLEKEVELAATIGAQILVLHPVCLGLDGKATPFARETVQRIAYQAGERAVRLALENTVDTAWALDRLLEELGDDPEQTNVGLCLDVGHAFLSRDLGPEPIRAYVERFWRQIIHLHVHDNRGERDDHLSVGEGRIDWRGLIEALREIDFAGTIALEVGEEGRAPSDVLRASQRAFDSFVRAEDAAAR